MDLVEDFFKAHVKSWTLILGLVMIGAYFFSFRVLRSRRSSNSSKNSSKKLALSTNLDKKTAKSGENGSAEPTLEANHYVNVCPFHRDHISARNKKVFV